jgi:hypothetical protein
MAGVTPEERPTPMGEFATARIRAIVAALPMVTERPSHGEATWFVNDKKTFVSMSDHHHNNRLFVSFAAASGVQEALIAQDPLRYFRPAYVGGRGWVGAYLDGTTEDELPKWDEVAELILDSWLLVAPMKFHALLDPRP